MRTRVFVGLLPLLVAAACGSTGDSAVQTAIDELKVRQDQAEQRLKETLARVSEAEQREQVAAKKATLAQCKAEVMQLGSEAAALHASCSLRKAGAAQCQARVAKANADNTLLGCLFGIGAAVATGGGAAPMALAGCGIGRTIGPDDDSCAEADCDPSIEAAHEAVLKAHRLPTIPMCGGEVGATLSPSAVRGVRVQEAVGGMTAQTIGVHADDVLVSVNEKRVTDLESLARVLSSVPLGDPVVVRVYRQRSFLTLGGALQDEKLGVVLGEVVTVPNAAVKVTAVTPGSAAENAGLAVGDRLVRVGAASITSVASAYGLLALVDEGARVEFAYERRGAISRGHLTLGQRSSRHAF